MKKWFKLSAWVRLFAGSFAYMRSPTIPLYEKALMLVPAVLYWVLPDVLPYLPFDDIAVTLFLANWFINRMERKYPHIKEERR